MRLRIARKIERRLKALQSLRDLTHADETLRRAIVRVHRAWRAACPWYDDVRISGEPKRACGVNEDYFRGNRLLSTFIRRGAWRQPWDRREFHPRPRSLNGR